MPPPSPAIQEPLSHEEGFAANFSSTYGADTSDQPLSYGSPPASDNLLPKPDLARLSWYQLECGITGSVDHCLGPIKIHCMKNCIKMEDGDSDCTKLRSKCDEDLDSLIDQCSVLKWELFKDSIVEFLNNRLVKPGNKVELPPTWNLSSPGDIYDALHVIQSTSEDAMIHLAYGQMRLYKSVQERLKGWGT